MCGKGRRFLDAGFLDLKPLIKVDGKPMIEHVVNLFSGINQFVFVCNNDHLKITNLSEELLRIVPNAKVVGLPDHDLGPVYSLSNTLDLLDANDEVIVNYCDFSTLWDFDSFLDQVQTIKADGAIVAYRGFHPHMLGTTEYAFMRVDDVGKVHEIREKRSFTNDRMNEFASNGTYYFRTANILRESIHKLLACPPHENGEYYVSLLYNQMIANEQLVVIYETDYMLQWGMPEDLIQYQEWSDIFRAGENAWRAKRVSDHRIVDYWRNFFSKCPWHPYDGK